MVPTNTRMIANASSTTMSLSDEKNSAIFLMSIGIFGGLNELDQRVFLLRHNADVAHEFVKPRLFAQRQHEADQLCRFAGARVRAGKFNQRRLGTRSLN